MKINTTELARLMLEVAVRDFGDQPFSRRAMMNAAEKEVRQRGHWEPGDNESSRSTDKKSKGLALIDWGVTNLATDGSLVRQRRDTWRVRPETLTRVQKILWNRGTHPLIAPLLERHGFSHIQSRIVQERGTEVQKIRALDEIGSPVSLHVLVCWQPVGIDSEREIAAVKLVNTPQGGDFGLGLGEMIRKDSDEGVTHILAVEQRDGKLIRAAYIPLDLVSAVYASQREINDQSGASGSAPILWLNDPHNPKLNSELWGRPAVRDLAQPSDIPTDSSDHESDSFDDLLSIDYSSIGNDGAKRITKVVSGVKRDGRVREAVIKRAGGKCEREGCNISQKYAGFFDVHHILGAEKGDRVWNCVALCPNCHREAHFAPDGGSLNRALLLFASQFK